MTWPEPPGVATTQSSKKTFLCRQYLVICFHPIFA